MKEWAQNNIGTVKKQAELLSFDVENKLWTSGILGEESPDQLRNTVLFLIGLNVGLRAGDEYYALRHDAPDLPSQLSFKRNEKGVHYLLYQEDTMTKTNNGELNHMCKDRKVVWVYPSQNPVRCPVRIIDKYISLLPPVKVNSKKANFYLHSLERCTPAQWYGDQVVGLNTLCKVVKKMSEDANIPGFFTNHSLRCTSTTRLFRSGVDRKLIKEFTGHILDAVDAYQITSDHQREQLSKIIAGSDQNKHDENGPKCETEVKVAVNQHVNDSVIGCQMNPIRFDANKADQIGTMISHLINNRRGGKAKVTWQIEFSD